MNILSLVHSDSMFGAIFPKEGNHQTSEVRRSLKHGAFDTKVFGDGLSCLTVTISLRPLSFTTDLRLLFLSWVHALSSHLLLLKSLRVLPVISVSIRSSSYLPFTLFLKFLKCFFLGFIPQSTDVLSVFFFFSGSRLETLQKSSE